MSDYTKVVCECGWRGRSMDLDYARNPFSPEEALQGCPNCQEVVSPERTCFVACDVPDCWNEATHKRLCEKHYRELEAGE